MIKIFIVEDDMDLNRFVSVSLRNAGYDVVSCFDGVGISDIHTRS